MAESGLAVRISTIRHDKFIPCYQALKSYIALSGRFHISQRALKGLLQRVQDIETEVLNLTKGD